MPDREKEPKASQPGSMSNHPEPSSTEPDVSHARHARHARVSDDANASPASSSSSDASLLGVSGTRHGREAQRDREDQTSAFAGAENDSAYSRSMAQDGYVQALQHKARRRRILLILVLALLVVVIAVVVGVTAYFNSSNSKLSGGLSNATDALVEASSDEPYYVLCAVELDSAGKARGDETDAYLLIRVDEDAQTLTFVSIPTNLSVSLSDGPDHPLYEALADGGEAELIRQVSSLADVDIAHFVCTDAEGLSDMVDRLDGVNVDITEEVDDPYAGTEVLDAGEQTLDGRDALVYLRATNFQGGFSDTSENRISFMCAFMRQALTSSGLNFTSLVGDAGDYLSTDLKSAQLLSLGDVFRDFDETTVYSCVVPGYKSNGAFDLYEVSDDEWAGMVELLKAGEDPGIDDSSDADVVTSEVTVEIRNGADMTGAAADAASALEAAGYVINGVGNVTDATTYPETLVIYKDPAFEGAAKAITSALGAGRVVDGGDYYTFDTNVLVIIGQDWMPLA